MRLAPQLAVLVLALGRDVTDATDACLAWESTPDLDPQLVDYDPQPAKGAAPAHPHRVAGAAVEITLEPQSQEITLKSQLQLLDAYLRANPFPAVMDDPSSLFRPELTVAFANVTHRFVYFKPTKTAGTSIWRGWLEPMLCPPTGPGALQGRGVCVGAACVLEKEGGVQDRVHAWGCHGHVATHAT